MAITRHLIIHGVVQGVAYRDSMRRQALKWNITGWVRNRNNGTVEAMVQGEEAAVDKMCRWAQVGPSSARVTHVEVSEGSGIYTDFARLGNY